MVQVQPLIPYSKYSVLCLRLVDAPRDTWSRNPHVKKPIPRKPSKSGFDRSVTQR